MPGRRRQCQVLTQSEVLHFVGWLPYRTLEEFDNYCAKHSELEPFPPYDFGAPGQTSENDAEDGGGVLRGHLPYVSDLGRCLSVSNRTNFFAGMAIAAKKECYKALLGKDRDRERAQQKKQPTAPSSSRPTSQPSNNHSRNNNNNDHNNNNDPNNNHNSHDSSNNKLPLSSDNSHFSLNNQGRRLLLPPTRPGTLGHPSNLWRFPSHLRGRGRNSSGPLSL